MSDYEILRGDCREVLATLPAGSGTTGAVSVEHGRRFIGCELNPTYIDLCHARIGKALEERLW